jgi:hypothetical protein
MIAVRSVVKWAQIGSQSNSSLDEKWGSGQQHFAQTDPNIWKLGYPHRARAQKRSERGPPPYLVHIKLAQRSSA